MLQLVFGLLHTSTFILWVNGADYMDVQLQLFVLGNNPVLVGSLLSVVWRFEPVLFN